MKFHRPNTDLCVIPKITAEGALSAAFVLPHLLVLFLQSSPETPFSFLAVQIRIGTRDLQCLASHVETSTQQLVKKKFDIQSVFISDPD